MAHLEEILVHGVATQVWAQDSTAQQIDDMVKKGAYYTNPNILTNPLFRINQRGQTSYTLTKNYQYTIDGWWGHQVGGIIAISDDGISVTSPSDAGTSYCSFAQQLEPGMHKFEGQTITLSMFSVK